MNVTFTISKAYIMAIPFGFMIWFLYSVVDSGGIFTINMVNSIYYGKAYILE